jgi:HEAT repeat protein
MLIARSHRRPAAIAAISISCCVAILRPATLPAQSDSASSEQKPDDPPLLEELREQLDSPDPNQRMSGIEHATKLDKKWAALAVPRLINLLGDEGQSNRGVVRYGAIEALGRMGPGASDSLIEALENKNRLVRMGAADALGHLRDARAVEPLVKLLHDPDHEVGSDAGVQLGNIGEPSINCLLAALTEDDVLVRCWSASALGRIRDRRVVQPVGRMLFDPEQSVRDSAGESLHLLALAPQAGARGSEAISDRPSGRAQRESDAFLRKLVIEQMNAALRSDNSAARLAAAKSSFFRDARSRSSEVVDALATCLTDENQEVRNQAVTALFLTDHPNSIKPLVVALRDADPRIREQAVNGLHNKLQFLRGSQDEFLVAPLIQSLHDADSGVCRAAVEALRSVQSAARLNATEDLTKLLHDENVGVVTAAVDALAAFRDKRAADPICALLDDPKLRSKAAGALSALGDPRAVEPLRALFKEKDVPTILALGGKKDRDSVPDLIELLHDNDKEVRQAAVQALGSIGDPRAAVPLILLLRTDSDLTRTIAEALSNLKDPRAVEPMIAAVQPQNIVFKFNFRNDSPRAPSDNLLAWPLFNMGFVAIQPLAKALSSDSAEVRGVAAWVLYNLLIQGGGVDYEDMQPAIEPLAAALADSSPFVRRQAAKALGELGDTRAVPELIEAAKASEESAYRYSNDASVLSRIRDPNSIQPLIGLLTNPRPPARTTAARILGYMHEERAIDPLLSLLSDPSPPVRAAAALALGHLKAASATEPLLSLLKDDDEAVQLAVVEGLGRLGDKRAIDSLAELLAATDALPRPQSGEPLPGQQVDSDFQLRVAVAIALVRLDDPRGVLAVAALVKDSLDKNREHAATQIAISYLKRESLVPPMIAALGDPSIRVRIYAAVALGHIATPAAIDALLAKTDDHENLRNILPALAEAKDDRTLGALIKSLDDVDRNVRRTAAASIANLGNLAGADPLIKHLSDPSAEVRAALVDALVKLQAKSALSAVKSLANDEDPNVRAHAERAIKRLDR